MKEYRIAALRGRKENGKWVQILEIGGGESNTLTSAEKDNYVIVFDYECNNNRLY